MREQRYVGLDVVGQDYPQGWLVGRITLGAREVTKEGNFDSRSSSFHVRTIP
jgi:hypothetical protein